MKEIKLYECEHCHTKYASRSDAEKCESCHTKPKKIIGARYVSYGQNQFGVPVSITVIFENGSQAIYKR